MTPEEQLTARLTALTEQNRQLLRAVEKIADVYEASREENNEKAKQAVRQYIEDNPHMREGQAEWRLLSELLWLHGYRETSLEIVNVDYENRY